VSFLSVLPSRLFGGRLLLFTVGLLLSAFFLLSPSAQTQSDSRFVGLRHVSAAEVRQLLPEAANRPVFLDFSSTLCLDCQKMKPVLHQFRTQHPDVYFRAVDVNAERKTQGALLHAFKPLTVPALVAIDSRGEIRDVLYNYQPLQNLNLALKGMQISANHHH
jgi:thiol:disulfide interchange protein